MNYGQMKEKIQQYLEAYEVPFVDNLPVFIDSAEQRIYNEINLPATRKTHVGALTLGSGDISLTTMNDPFLAPISLNIMVDGMPVFLMNKELDYLSEMYPASIMDQPTLYAQADESRLVVRPVPNDNYVYTLQYYAKTDSLVSDVDDNNTSWLSDNYDGVLLFGALVEGAIFNKQDPTVYEAGFNAKLALLKTLIDGKNQQDQYRQGAPRKQVPKEK